jgi:hypothetical protein
MQPLSKRRSVPIGDVLMNIAQKSSFVLSQRRLLGIERLLRENFLNLLTFCATWPAALDRYQMQASAAVVRR